MKKVGMLFLTVVFCVVSVTAEASLIVRGTGTITSSGGGFGGSYKLIYDDAQDITWLDFSKSYDDWCSQMAWASALTVDFGGQTYDNWRLPITDESQANLTGPWPNDPDTGNGNGFGWGGPDGSGYHDYRFGYNMVNSEMGHLYYESLGNKGYYATDGTPQPGYGLVNTGDFDNLGRGDYWSGTEYSPDTDFVWDFYFDGGYQGSNYKYHGNWALAVLPGDVSAVPIPGAVWLLGSAMAGLGWLKRSRRRHG